MSTEYEVDLRAKLSNVEKELTSEFFGGLGNG